MRMIKLTKEQEEELIAWAGKEIRVIAAEIKARDRAIGITIPVRAVSTLNTREHWSTRAKRAKAHRKAAIAVPKFPVPCVVKMTRIGPRMLDDDNLQGALKSIRDGIADRLGVDDADPRVTWEYDQEKGKEYAVRIELR